MTPAEIIARAALLLALLLSACASMPSRNMADMTAEQLRMELARPIGVGK